MSKSTVRYKDSVQPIRTDGRDIDLQLAMLTGEAAHQEASGGPGKHIEEYSWTWNQLPEPKPHDPTYYDRPLLNESVWSWAIPTYYYVGGLAGASLALAAAVQTKRSTERGRLINRCHWIGFIGCCVSGALLIYDLGRPTRFLNMLRVFRPTSPMNVGAWILSGTSGSAFFTLLLRGRGGLLGTLGESAGYVSGVMGMGLATYTGVLVSNTAVPVWQASRHLMPILFACSAITSVGSLFTLLDQNPEESRITHSFGTAGKIAEIAAGIVMERQASEVPRVGRPFRKGVSGLMWRTAAVLTASSLILSVLPNKTRERHLASGVLGTVGSLLMRFAVERLGTASVRDPRASFHRQRSDKSPA